MASKKTVKKKTVKKKTVKKTLKEKKPATPKQVPRYISEQENKKDAIPHMTKDNITPHDKFNSMIFIIGLLGVIILLIIVSPMNKIEQSQNPEAIEGTHILLSFDKPNMKVGDTVTLTIEGREFDDLVGYEFSVGFNDKVLRYESLTYGNILGGNQGRICVPQKNLGNQIKNIACIKLPSVPGTPEGVSGSGSMASITFEVIGRGDLLLQMDNIKLLDSNKESIDYQVISPKIMVK